MSAPSGTVVSSTLNLTNTILGAGLLAMPHAFISLGLPLGLVLVVFFGSLSALSLHLYTLCASAIPQGHASFSSLAKRTWPKLQLLFEGAIVVKCWGVSVSYLLVIGNVMPTVVDSFRRANLSEPEPILSRRGIIGDMSDANQSETLAQEALSTDSQELHNWQRVFWITIAMVLVTPLTFQRRLDALKYTSTFALTAVAYIIFLVIYFFFNQDQLPNETHTFAALDALEHTRADDGGDEGISPPTSKFSFLMTIPILVFAYTCHQNIFTVYNEMADLTQRRITKSILLSIGISIFCYGLVGTLGFFMFGSTVKGNVIEMFPETPIVTIGRLGIAILFVFSYPLQIHPARASLDKVLGSRKKSKITASPLPQSESLEELFASTSTNRSSRVISRVHSEEYVTQSLEYIQTGSGDEYIVQGGIHQDEARVHTDGPVNEMSRKKLVGMTTGLMITGYFLACIVDNLDDVLGFVGATGSTTITYLLPSIFFYSMFINSSSRYHSLLRKMCVFMVALGLSVFIGSVGGRLVSIFTR